MRNKIITLTCILAIVVTTAIVAFAGEGDTTNQYIHEINQKVETENLIDQTIKGGAGGYLYPTSSLTREVQVTNSTDNRNLLVRTIFAFEADDFENVTELQECIEVTFNNNENWNVINYGLNSNRDYMLVAVYKGILDKNSSIGLEYKVYMKPSVTNEIAENIRDGEGYEVKVITQAVQADGWSYNGRPVDSFDSEAIKGILNTAFGEITSENHPWKTNN